MAFFFFSLDTPYNVFQALQITSIISTEKKKWPKQRQDFAAHKPFQYN